MVIIQTTIKWCMFSEIPVCWGRFIDSLEIVGQECRDKTLQEFKATLKNNGSNAILEFETESDLLYFILRWS